MQGPECGWWLKLEPACLTEAKNFMSNDAFLIKCEATESHLCCATTIFL